MQSDRHGVEIVVEQVRVGVEGDLRRLVPEHQLKRQDVDACGHRQRGASVPSVVGRYRLDLGACDCPGELSPLRLRPCQIAAVRARKHEIGRILALALPGQLVEDERRHRHPSGLASLRRADRVIHAQLHRVLVDIEPTTAEFHVANTQRDRFTPSEAGVGQYQHQGTVLARLRGEPVHVVGPDEFIYKLCKAL